MASCAFASLVHVRVLLLPVGPIPRATFEAYASEIRAFDSIRLGDIPADAKGERARFMPNPLSSGHLHLSFSSHPSLSTHFPLSLFRPSLFNLGVIGIAACSSTCSLSAALEHFENALIETSPEGSIFPLAKTCFAFQDDDGPSISPNEIPPGLVVIPTVMGNKKLYIGTLLADLCSQILSGFGRVVHILETPIGNEYLNAGLFPTLPAVADMRFALESHAHLSQHSSISHTSQPELTSSSLSALANQSRKQNSANQSSNSLHRQSTLGSLPAKKRPSAVGATSSHGRLYKVYGDFHLLSGRIQDAKIWYQEASTLFKTGMDPVWQASTIESLAVLSVLESWAAAQGLQTSASDMKEPWVDIYDQLSQAVALYLKANGPVDTGQDWSLLTLIYTTAVLRQTSLLLCVWSSKGWGPLAFASMLHPEATSYLQKITSDYSWVNVERLSTITGITRFHIATTISQAHGPWLLHLGAYERLVLLQSMASIYKCLGFERKEAYILREVISCIMDLIVCGRNENDQLRKSDLRSAGLVIHTSGLESGEGAAVSPTKGSIGMRLNENLEGNQSILRLLIYACRVLGLDLESVTLAPTPKSADDDSQREHGHPSEDVALTEALGNSFGWPELQVGVVREAIAVAEALPDQLAVARFSLSALKTMHFILTPGDQNHLYQTASRALAATRRRGAVSAVEYWATRPILSIAVPPLPLHRLPIEKPISLLASSPSPAGLISAAVKDPFLYNPRKSINSQGKTFIVQGEVVDLIITLHNPLVLELELQNVSLITSGVTFECNGISSINIPPNSLYPITVSGVAKDHGILTIKGCMVQAPNGAPRAFILPASTEVEEDRQTRRQSLIGCETGRTKYAGLDSRPWEKGGQRFGMPMPALQTKTRFLECTVVPKQPLLRIRWTSLTHAAVMLYDGEKLAIRLTLENVSALPVDFLRLSFEDSTIGPAQEALSEGNLNAFESYEIEYDLVHRPAFSWQSDNEVKVINPGQKIVMSVTCLGKVGCTSGAVHVSYAFVHRPDDGSKHPFSVFHTRQLTYPVAVTVYHMLECHAMRIMPLTALSCLDYDPLHTNTLLTGVGDPHGWCLFSVEVRNTYGLPFEVTFDCSQDDGTGAEGSSVVSPGSMSRIIIPIRRFRLAEETVSRPIPALSDRQFVVAKSHLSATEEKAQRELFWYREELLKIVRGRWKEVHGHRHGDLSLRQQHMTMHMLKALRTDRAPVHLSLVQYGHDDDSPPGGGSVIHSNTIVNIRTRITNAGTSTLFMTLSLTPSPEEHVLFEGHLTDIPLGKIESGHSQVVETPICFLCTGRFEIVAEARVVGVAEEDGRAGVDRLHVIIRE
ncbi:TRAPP II complex [Phlebopus sp. FC_14]|nr:TRAPP II complex [Phlebopus sp. FC_14]